MARLHRVVGLDARLSADRGVVNLLLWVGHVEVLPFLRTRSFRVLFLKQKRASHCGLLREFILPDQKLFIHKFHYLHEVVYVRNELNVDRDCVIRLSNRHYSNVFN